MLRWLCLAVVWPSLASILEWPDVLGNTWLFDQGSTFGYRPEADGQAAAIRGPAPDWSLGSNAVPLIRFQAWQEGGDQRVKETGTCYPGSILVTSKVSALQLSAHLAFDTANASLVKLTLQNAGPQAVLAKFSVTGLATNLSLQPSGVGFGLPATSTPCFSHPQYQSGSATFTRSLLLNGMLRPLGWNVTANSSSFRAMSDAIHIPAAGVASTFVVVSSVRAPPALTDAQDTALRFVQAIQRWEAYLDLVHGPRPGMAWVTVKSLMTLLGNWRVVPGRPSGVLPSYTGYQGGFWSWDTYKQAVGMAKFAPELAKDQLRLLVSARDGLGHIPDKVDRCGQGGGCSGKPPLLGWAVWEVAQYTHDHAFLREMYPIVVQFHRFWYAHRDVTGAGLCAWTEGMESGMDDGVRFLPAFAKSVTNTSTHVTTLDFWSIDLNAYLYYEKRLLSRMAMAQGLQEDARRWDAAAEALALKLQIFFVPMGDRNGFFSDVYFNGTALPIKGCEGFVALFSGVATLSQAGRVLKTLRDPDQFFLNFSLPTVSKDNPYFNPKGYWKGPTWVDQTWFAYAGLQGYAALAKEDSGSAEEFAWLASELKRKLFLGKGFTANDTTPLNEHYDPETGVPGGVTHFSWTAAHVLMWALEEDPEQAIWV
ncbi:unnamed protein product [Effrenium voratum]|uniref:Mannosylglycerate hydrolase MGH1-like glycoside hydrolase domain-containing protein n=1 Tax=Effrenium voratum TaxID=2562239 RepID=A0AA36JJC2_9DINO|nr:unnamed protein product [Effrenium voratum]CAJ1416543.1 unnamed protein product [Effrenium voratum]